VAASPGSLACGVGGCWGGGGGCGPKKVGVVFSLTSVCLFWSLLWTPFAVFQGSCGGNLSPPSVAGGEDSGESVLTVAVLHVVVPCPPPFLHFFAFGLDLPHLGGCLVLVLGYLMGGGGELAPSPGV